MSLHGALLARVDDRFLIRGLPPADVAALPEERELRRNLLELRRRVPSIESAAAGTVAIAVPLAGDMGRRYGAVAGDRNPVHTTPLLARLFGVKRCFMQGLGLRNAVVAALARHGLPLGQLEIRFAYPAYLGQTLQLRAAGGSFELLDEAQQLVAFGTAR